MQCHLRSTRSETLGVYPAICTNPPGDSGLRFEIYGMGKGESRRTREVGEVSQGEVGLSWQQSWHGMWSSIRPSEHFLCLFPLLYSMYQLSTSLGKVWNALRISPSPHPHPPTPTTSLLRVPSFKAKAESGEWKIVLIHVMMKQHFY